MNPVVSSIVIRQVSHLCYTLLCALFYSDKLNADFSAKLFNNQRYHGLAWLTLLLNFGSNPDPQTLLKLKVVAVFPTKAKICSSFFMVGHTVLPMTP